MPDEAGLSVSDVWPTITIHLSGKQANGTFTAQGQEDVLLGDEAWSGKLVGSGKISLDNTKPEARSPSGLKGFGPPDQRLPWDVIPVSFAEPLNSSEALSKVGLFNDEQGSGAAVAVTWLTPSANPKTTGVSSLQGVLQSWDNQPSSPIPRVGPDYHDPRGNPGAEFSKTIAVMMLPPATAPSESFDGDVVGYASWGGAIRLGGLAPAPAPECEGYGCLLLGPFLNGACGVESSGIATRLSPAQTKANGIQGAPARALLGQRGHRGDAPGLNNLPVLSMQLARAGKARRPTTSRPRRPKISARPLASSATPRPGRQSRSRFRGKWRGRLRAQGGRRSR